MVSRANLYLLTRARRGDALAQLELGQLYLEGAPGLPKNQAVALDWLLRAARQGQEEAARLLSGAVTDEALLENPRVEELIPWLRRAAEAGAGNARWVYVQVVDRYAAMAAAEFPGATALAARFVGELAQTGFPPAQWRFSQLAAAQGQTDLALYWARAASDAGSDAARIWIAHQLRDQPDMSVFARFAEPVVDAILEQRIPATADDLGLLFDFYRAHGWGHERAQAALQCAAEGGLVEAQYVLGCLHLDAEQLDERNKVHVLDQQALRKLLSIPGDFPAQTSRPPASLRNGVRWLMLAAEQQHANACYLLGLLFRVPAYSKRNLADSDEWFQKAADLGQPDAQYWLSARLWRNRARTPEADVTAALWALRAANSGHAAAERLLAQISTRADASRDGDAAFAQVSDETIERIAVKQPLAAMRLRVARAFRLKRIEALLLDLPAADRGGLLLVDISAWTTKHTRRIIRITDQRQRQILDSAVRLFNDVDQSPAGPEGSYRQRLYLFGKLLEETTLARRSTPALPLLGEGAAFSAA